MPEHPDQAAIDAARLAATQPGPRFDVTLPAGVLTSWWYEMRRQVQALLAIVDAGPPQSSTPAMSDAEILRQARALLDKYVPGSDSSKVLVSLAAARAEVAAQLSHTGMEAHSGYARHSHEVRPDHLGVPLDPQGRKQRFIDQIKAAGPLPDGETTYADVKAAAMPDIAGTVVIRAGDDNPVPVTGLITGWADLVGEPAHEWVYVAWGPEAYKEPHAQVLAREPMDDLSPFSLPPHPAMDPDAESETAAILADPDAMAAIVEAEAETGDVSPELRQAADDAWDAGDPDA